MGCSANWVGFAGSARGTAGTVGRFVRRESADPPDHPSDPPALGRRIRLAAAADGATIASLNIRAWQWAYRGQLPDPYLDGLSARIERATIGWTESITQPTPSHRIWVAEQAGVVVGFASTGQSRDQDATAATAEVYTIYLERAVARTGIGRMLFAHAVEDLHRRRYAAATLWVLETNERARRFYEVAGWQADGATKVEERAGVVLRELRYRIDF
jgi:ribosomal protein S18 acetylase RimI-like enzyme